MHSAKPNIMLCSSNLDKVPTVAPHIAKYGVTKGLLQHVLTKYPVVAKNLQHCLAKYYCLYWSGEHLRKQVQELDMLSHYVIIFHDITPERAYRSDQVFISFREAQPEFSLPCYAMICRAN